MDFRIVPPIVQRRRGRLRRDRRLGLRRRDGRLRRASSRRLHRRAGDEDPLDARAVLQRVHLVQGDLDALLDVEGRVVGERAHGGLDADGAQLLRAQAGVGAVALVFDPGQGVDGPDAVDADLRVGVAEVREPGLEEGALGDEELFVLGRAVGEVDDDVGCREDDLRRVVDLAAGAVCAGRSSGGLALGNGEGREFGGDEVVDFLVADLREDVVYHVRAVLAVEEVA